MRRWVVGVLLAAALVPGVASGALTGSPAAAPGPLPLAATRPFPRPSRIALLILENRSYGQVIGNPSAPYLNSLARSGALATHYYAITHPSLPNYVAMTTGGHAEVSSDCAQCASDGRSLVDQLDAAGASWRAYFQSLPSRLATPYSRAAPYNRHYNPFVYTETLKPTDLAAAHITGFKALHDDLVAQTLPDFAWIAPNKFNDGHSTTLASVDRYASYLVPKILRALGPRGVLLITFDEGRPSDHSGLGGRGGGHIPLIAVGPAAARGVRVPTPANHYALLRTIEATFGVHALGHAGARSTPVLTGLLR
jgi:phosphatidylinositol-3-phosphatase